MVPEDLWVGDADSGGISQGIFPPAGHHDQSLGTELGPVEPGHQRQSLGGGDLGCSAT